MPDTKEQQFYRLFVAVSVPQAVRSEIEKAQSELRRALPDGSVRWTRPEHFHLTLRFLGNVAVERTDELSEKLSVASGDFGPVRVRAERIGFFPERGHPRVIWVSLGDREEKLAALQRKIQEATFEFTTEPLENEFSGHITLGRVKKIGRSEADTLAGLAQKMRERFFGEWTVNSVELMKSELLPDGVHHTVLTTVQLSGAK